MGTALPCTTGDAAPSDPSGPACCAVWSAKLAAHTGRRDTGAKRKAHSREMQVGCLTGKASLNPGQGRRGGWKAPCAQRVVWTLLLKPPAQQWSGMPAAHHMRLGVHHSTSNACLPACLGVLGKLFGAERVPHSEESCRCQPRAALLLSMVPSRQQAVVKGALGLGILHYSSAAA